MKEIMRQSKQRAIALSDQAVHKFIAIEKARPAHFGDLARKRGFTCAAVETVMHSDDLVGPTAMDLSPFAGEFDRPLDRFGAAVGEERPMQSAVASYQIGKADHWRVVIGRAAVQKLLGL